MPPTTDYRPPTTDQIPRPQCAMGKRTRSKPQKPPCPGAKGWRLLWFQFRGNKFQAPNSKYQAPNSKFQMPPTTDYRPPTKFQRRSGKKNEVETTKTSLPRP